MFQKNISRKNKFYFYFYFWVLFEKLLKLPGRSQAVGADYLAADPLNLKYFKENLNFISLFIFCFRIFFEAFQVWRVCS
jgi:hypothetical protein